MNFWHFSFIYFLPLLHVSCIPWTWGSHATWRDISRTSFQKACT